MNFNDMIKKSVIDGFSYADLTTTEIIITLVITFAIALYIFQVYKLVTKSAFYFKSFNVSMAIISVVTAGIILAMQSSIVISLGMVGALSIVRFRTAVKEPMDLCFLFWSIAVGICCGAHMTEIALVLSVILTVLVIVLDRLPIGRAPMILVADLGSLSQEKEFMDMAAKYCRYYRIKSRNISDGRCNLVLEVRTAGEYEMLQEMEKLEGISSISLVSHDGEVTF